MRQRHALGDEMMMERCPGYVRVWQQRSAKTVAEADEVCAAMDAAMDDWGQHRLLFDSRDADETPPDVGARIWTWMIGHRRLERVATLVDSEALAESVNLRGVGTMLRIRSFPEEAAAVGWLTSLT